jgi:hypothetical protein
MSFQIGDRVKYRDGRLLTAYPDEIKGKVGEVLARVQGVPNAYVVEFGADAFIVNGDHLLRHYFKDEQTGPVIEKVLRKWQVEEM